MMHITEDTPPDMLAGAMDLTVHLPTGRSVKLSVERSTPMMDLLVQITTAHNLQLSGHILEAMDMTRTGGIGDRVLPYKPNTPIGALDTQHIKVVPKNKTASTFPKSLSTGHQPFESTFRLKVHLPRNQLYVTRVSQNVYLEEIVKKVCEEKGLDPTKYELRHPGNLDEVLDPKLTLSDYQITEIYVVGKGSGRLTQTFSSSDIMALRKEEERKQFQAKTGGGVFNLIFKRSKTTAPEPTHSHSVTQPVELPKPSTVPVIKDPPQPDPRPKPPQRKRRPAPKPPVEAKNPTIERNPRPVSCSSNTGLIISHSRNSSDSSGYHEASVLSENCNTSLPRRPKSIYDENGNRAKVNGVHSRSTGNLEKMQGQSKSMSSLAAPARKKKAAPPPPKPPVQKPDADTVEPASPVVASQPIETITESISTNITTNITPPESPIISSPQTQNKSTPLVDPTEEIKETPIILETKPNESELKSETNDFDNKNEVDSGICENNLSDTAEKEEIIEKNIGKNSDNVLKVEPEWQYQLPSPPKGFRDVSPSLQTYECETETVSDSVVTSPELFEKLKRVHDIQSLTSDLPSVVSQEEIFEEKDICNKLTLENLEKRKSLVYNRELATSLKYAESEANSDKRSNVMLELEDVIANEKSSTFLRSNNSKPSADSKNDRHLPNFKISTYDTKKEKINIFEDETVRSSENSCKVTPEKEKGSDDVPEQPIVLRAESFSGPRLPLNPVRRSKSQVALNKYKDTKQNSCNESVSRSNSLLDVSGLQSLEVMKIIQNKLSSSKDTINKIPEPEPKQEKIEPPPIEKKPVKEPISPIKEPTLTTTTNSYTAPKRQFYQGPPCIELGSWSQRPKTEITLKEDTDYKLGTGTLRTNSSTVYLSNSSNFKKQNGTSVKIGKPNHVVTTQAQGSVVISINNEQKETDRESNQFKNEMFRKPIEKQRPHSIAIDNRIPIVRSVELKKEFQDLPSKSITEITSNVINFDNQPKSMSYVNLFANNENPDKTYRKDSFSRTVVRNNSFTPVVRGFRVPNVSNETINKKPWESYGTLPNNKSSSPGQDSSANKQTRTSEVFSQTTLRRTDSSHSVNNNANTNGKHVFGNVVLRNNSNKYSKPEYRHSASVIPPPPPVMLKPVKKVSNPTPVSMDSRDRLLDEIRNFGGKKGLKTTK